MSIPHRSDNFTILGCPSNELSMFTQQPSVVSTTTRKAVSVARCSSTRRLSKDLAKFFTAMSAHSLGLRQQDGTPWRPLGTLTRRFHNTTTYEHLVQQMAAVVLAQINSSAGTLESKKERERERERETERDRERERAREMRESDDNSFT